MVSVFQNNPLLRILLPLASGIIVSEISHVSYIVATLLILLSLAVYTAIFIYSKRNPVLIFRTRPYFSICLCTAIFALSLICAEYSKPKTIDISAVNGNTLCGEIKNIIYTDNSTRIDLCIVADSTAKTLGITGKTTIDLRLENYDYSIKIGDIIGFTANLTPITNQGNPDEFDYATYMRHKGILYRQWISDENNYRILGHNNSIINNIRNLHQNISSKIINTHLKPSTQAFILAIVMGDRQYISTQLQDQFSQSGIAHMLALSGLHIGFIFMLLFFLLMPLDFVGLKRFKLALVLLIMIFYVALTGFSISVMRAALMNGFALIAFMLRRKSSSLNALFGAAILILIFSPSALFEISFQLSFFSVFFIIALTPIFYNQLNRRHRIRFYIASLFITSAIASISTAAFTAYYFHTVSLISIFTNFLVIPILPIFISVACLFVFCAILGQEYTLIDTMLSALYSLIEWVSSFATALPISHLSNVYISPTFLFIFTLLLIIVAYRANHKSTLATCLICITTALSISTLYISQKQKAQFDFAIFSNYHCTPIISFANDSAFVWAPDDELDINDFTRLHRSFFARNHIRSVMQLTDTCTHDNILTRKPFAILGNKRIIVADYARWKDVNIQEKVNVDYIIITKGFNGDILTLYRLFNFNTIIFSADIYSKKREQLLQQASALNIISHDISKNGAFICK